MLKTVLKVDEYNNGNKVGYIDVRITEVQGKMKVSAGREGEGLGELSCGIGGRINGGLEGRRDGKGGRKGRRIGERGRRGERRGGEWRGCFKRRQYKKKLRELFVIHLLKGIVNHMGAMAQQNH